MAELTIRPATPDDAPGIAVVHVDAWEAAYRGLVPDELLDGRSIDERERQWRSLLTDSGPPERTAVAERAGRIAGFCSVAAPSRDQDAPAGAAEIVAIYVAPGEWRCKIGSALLAAALADLRREGWEEATLWVLEGNARAQAFYAAHGFVPTEGEHRRVADLPERRMRRSLAGSPRRAGPGGGTQPQAGLTAGELWTRGQLERLLRRRFSPPAIVGFLWASWLRSAQVRRERPQLARRAWRWSAVGAAAWLALAASGREPFRRRLRAGLSWWSATAVMLDWHLGMVETADGRPRNLGPADALTLARAWLVPVALDAPTPLVCGLAAATDVLDGRLARLTAPTRAGRDLEGLVDACFAAAALRGARERGWLGRHVVAAELARLGAGVAYGLGVYFGRARAPSTRVLRAGRATTAVRAGGLMLAGTRRRRAAEALLLTGSAASVALLARALRSAG